MKESDKRKGQGELGQAWQMFSVKGQVVHILGFVAIWLLSQLLNSAVIPQKQP